MSEDATPCPKCGGTEFTDNSGFDHRTTHYGVHYLGHGMQGHAPTFFLAMAAVAFLGRLFIPLRLTCQNPNCGHSFKA